jgi:hypothetical protein
LIEVSFRKHERLLDAQAGSPQQHDEPARATAMLSVPGRAHNSDDLFDLWRIGRVAQPLVARSVTGMESWQRRRRSTSTGTIEQKLEHDPS